MVSIKCANCGHLNPIKNEFLVFCSACNRKLDNNFSEWSKRNPGKSLDDFKQIVGVTGSEKPDVKQKERKSVGPKKRTLKYWIGFSITFAIFYAIGTIGGEKLVSLFRSNKTEKQILNEKWSKETYGEYGLSVETPVRLIRTELPIPENLRRIISRIDTYKYDTAKGFKILINSIEYKPEIGSVNLQAGALGSVNEMKMQPGVTEFNYTEEYISKNGIPGFVQRGSFKKDDVAFEFINTGFGSELSFGQVSLLYTHDDEVGRIASERIFNSIEILHGEVAELN